MPSTRLRPRETHGDMHRQQAETRGDRGRGRWEMEGHPFLAHGVSSCSSALSVPFAQLASQKLLGSASEA